MTPMIEDLQMIKCGFCRYWHDGNKPCSAPSIFPDSAYARGPGLRRKMREDDGKQCKLFMTMTQSLLPRERQPDVIYKEAVDKWGHNSQMNMLIEECAELIAAINRFRRERTDLIPLLEEIADVEIMLGQIRCIFDAELIDIAKRKKLTRLAERVGLLTITGGC